MCLRYAFKVRYERSPYDAGFGVAFRRLLANGRKDLMGVSLIFYLGIYDVHLMFGKTRRP